MATAAAAAVARSEREALLSRGSQWGIQFKAIQSGGRGLPKQSERSCRSCIGNRSICVYAREASNSCTGRSRSSRLTTLRDIYFPLFHSPLPLSPYRLQLTVWCYRTLVSPSTSCCRTEVGMKGGRDWAVCPLLSNAKWEMRPQLLTGVSYVINDWRKMAMKMMMMMMKMMMVAEMDGGVVQIDRSSILR